ncbi:MAG: hypothetical protein K6G80_07675 [Treponema sp.]|nr:hypothetical protein [Treponema sp.]
MEARDNPVFGRKVFFLNPPYQITQFVVSRLRDDEYEIYVIDDYKDAKNILRHYPDSICFINIDSKLTLEEWLNFVVSLEREEALKSIFLGIITKGMRASDKTHFMLHTNVPAGFLSFNGNVTELTATLSEILNLNGARGRRQSVRASCEHDATASITLPTPIGDRAFHMIDISSVGIAARAPAAYAPVFKPNTLFRNAPIHFGSNHVQGTLALYAIKQQEKSITLIFLFTAGTPNSVKSIIRQYVAENLQYEMRMAIDGEPKDETDYSNSVTFDEDAFLVEDKGD